MPPLRIARVIPFFTRPYGGCVTQARAVNEWLARRGHDVRVVTSDLGCPPATPRDTWLEERGYRVWYGRTQAIHRVPPYWMPMLRKPLLAVLAEAEVLTLNVGLTLLHALARRLARPLHTPYVYNAEGALCPQRLCIKAARKRLFLRLYERRILADAAAVQAVTEKEIVDLARQGVEERRIRVIPNGVSLPNLDSLDAQAFRDHCGIAPETRIVLFLGRLHQIKGIDLLVRGFAGIAASSPTTMLIIAGSDEEGTRRETTRLAEELGIGGRIRFAGLVGDALRASAFAAASVFALTSRSEGLPNAVLEACAHGVPVLVTAACNVPEVVPYGAGRIVDPEPSAITAALREMLVDAEGRHSMREGARRMIAERFTIDAVGERLEQLYAEIAATRNRSHA